LLEPLNRVLERDEGYGQSWRGLVTRRTAKGENRIMTSSTVKIAVLDDYQNIALKMADWSAIPGDPEITVFNDHVSELEPLIQRLFSL
jgi:hypothetical protein